MHSASVVCCLPIIVKMQLRWRVRKRVKRVATGPLRLDVIGRFLSFIKLVHLLDQQYFCRSHFHNRLMTVSPRKLRMVIAAGIALLQLVLLPATSVVHRCEAPFNLCLAGSGESGGRCCDPGRDKDSRNGESQETPRWPDSRQCPICHAVWAPGSLSPDVDAPACSGIVSWLRQRPVIIPCLARRYRCPNRGPPLC